ncbi:MAG: NADH-quinone oxidoreductase subunit NuoE [Saprospiraceae bacterium]|jgi:NADH-quinone oxidoreductase subunit E
MNIDFSKESMDEIARLIAQYPSGRKKSALLPVLHVVQKEKGWLSADTMEQVALLLEIKPIEVFEVATFYSMYFTKPVGKYVIEICQTGPCMICGAEDIIAYLERKLSIKVGETTSDGMFTLKTVECLGACGYAPMFQIGETFYENLTSDKIDEIISQLSSKANTGI